MNCKKALIICNGDVEKAKQWLRDSGTLAARANKKHNDFLDGLKYALSHVRNYEDRMYLQFLIAVEER